MTPADIADLLTERVTDVSAIAAQRYPHNGAARREDEVAQLRLLVEQAAEWLRQLDRERERHVERIAHLTAVTEVLEAGHQAAADNYARQFARQARKLAKLRKKEKADA